MVSIPQFRVYISDPGPLDELRAPCGWCASQALPLVEATRLCHFLQTVGARAEVTVASKRLAETVQQFGNEVQFERASDQVAAAAAYTQQHNGPAVAYLLLSRPRRQLTGWRGFVARLLGLEAHE